MTHLSLFSGIGGLDIAGEWAGFRTVGQCEWADYPTKVLEKHWPDVPRWRDIRTLTGDDFYVRTGSRTVDIISGGFPCQPHSLAGKRLASADERDLWDECARVVCEINPKWFLGENVEGLLSSENGRFFGRVLRDLALLGYRTEWHCFPAASVGTPHFRNRTFLLALNTNRINDRSLGECEGFQQAPIASRMHRQILRPKWEKDSGSGRVYITTRNREQLVNEPGICRVAYGIPHRMERLHCLGNSVVPQQAYPIFQAIADIEKEAHT